MPSLAVVYVIVVAPFSHRSATATDVLKRQRHRLVIAHREVVQQTELFRTSLGKPHLTVFLVQRTEIFSDTAPVVVLPIEPEALLTADDSIAICEILELPACGSCTIEFGTIPNLLVLYQRAIVGINNRGGSEVGGTTQ